MMGLNWNLMQPKSGQYLTVDGTSDTLTIPVGVRTVSLYSTTDCWVSIGKAPTAAAPGAEKTVVTSFFVPSSMFIDINVPAGTDNEPTKIAAIQDTAAGVLYATHQGG